jgi:hypothetical protein
VKLKEIKVDKYNLNLKRIYNSNKKKLLIGCFKFKKKKIFQKNKKIKLTVVYLYNLQLKTI